MKIIITLVLLLAALTAYSQESYVYFKDDKPKYAIFFIDTVTKDIIKVSTLNLKVDYTILKKYVFSESPHDILLKILRVGAGRLYSYQRGALIEQQAEDEAVANEMGIMSAEYAIYNIPRSHYYKSQVSLNSKVEYSGEENTINTKQSNNDKDNPGAGMKTSYYNDQNSSNYLEGQRKVKPANNLDENVGAIIPNTLTNSPILNYFVYAYESERRINTEYVSKIQFLNTYIYNNNIEWQIKYKRLQDSTNSVIAEVTSENTQLKTGFVATIRNYSKTHFYEFWSLVLAAVTFIILLITTVIKLNDRRKKIREEQSSRYSYRFGR